jgi:hypothetical protein
MPRLAGSGIERCGAKVCTWRHPGRHFHTTNPQVSGTMVSLLTARVLPRPVSTSCGSPACRRAACPGAYAGVPPAVASGALRNQILQHGMVVRVWRPRPPRSTADPCPSPTAWILEPGLPRSTWLGPVRSDPPFDRPDLHRVNRGSRPVDLTRRAEHVQHALAQHPFGTSTRQYPLPYSLHDRSRVHGRRGLGSAGHGDGLE